MLDWSFQAGGGLFTAPVTAGGMVYVGMGRDRSTFSIPVPGRHGLWLAWMAASRVWPSGTGCWQRPPATVRFGCWMLRDAMNTGDGRFQAGQLAVWRWWMGSSMWAAKIVAGWPCPGMADNGSGLPGCATPGRRWRRQRSFMSWQGMSKPRPNHG